MENLLPDPGDGRMAKEEKNKTNQNLTALGTLCLVGKKVISTKKSAFTSSYIISKLVKIVLEGKEQKNVNIWGCLDGLVS